MIKSGSFVLNAGTGDQEISGLGFKPKAIVAFAQQQTADGSAASWEVCVGFGTSTSQAVSSTKATDGSNPTRSGRRTDNTKFIQVVSDDGSTTVISASLKSLNSDGFTINIASTDGVQRVINYLAIGGNRTLVELKEVTTNTGTGSQTFSTSFKPDLIFIHGTVASSTTLNVGANGAIMEFGIAKSPTKQGAMSLRTGSTVATQIDEKRQGTASCVIATNGGATFHEANLTSMNEGGGFTVNWSTANATARYLHVLCVKNVSVEMGSFNQATGTGNASVTSSRFRAKTGFWFSFNNITTSSIVEDTRHSFGLANSPFDRRSLWIADQDNVSPQNASSNLDSTKVLKMMTPASGSPTTDAAADFVSYDASGFTWNWTTADATAREIIYLLLADIGTIS